MAFAECPRTVDSASPSRRARDTRPLKLRSAVTNGARMFVEGDSQSVWARRRRDLEDLISDDLGGASVLTEIQRGLVATAATLRVELEALEGKLSEGGAVDLDGYARVASHYRRICETLGLERIARDVSPDIKSYLAGKGRAPA